MRWLAVFPELIVVFGLQALYAADLETEAAYYARKVGITVFEAAKIIREARAPKLSIVRKDKFR